MNSPTHNSNTPRYPAFDTGLPLSSPADVIASHSEMIKRIKVAVSEDEYSEMLEPVIWRYAEFIHLLPATRNEYYRGAGGLFAMGLKMGFFCLQASDGLVFTANDRVEDRLRLTTFWRYAAFYTGLCSEIASALSALVVTSDDGEEWSSYLAPLHQWASERKLARYFVNWGKHQQSYRHQSISTFYDISKLLPSEIIQRMQTASPRMVKTMMDAVSGITEIHNTNVLAQAVRRIRLKLIDQDMKSDALRYGAVMVGSHLEPYLIGAMRQLVRDGTWKCNKPKSRLWLSEEGLFLVWPTAGKEILAVLENEQITGATKDADTIADFMVKAGIFEYHPVDRFWNIILPGSKRNTALQALRIIDPTLIRPFDAHVEEWTVLTESLFTEGQESDAHGLVAATTAQAIVPDEAAAKPKSRAKKGAPVTTDAPAKSPKAGASNEPPTEMGGRLQARPEQSGESTPKREPATPPVIKEPESKIEQGSDGDKTAQAVLAPPAKNRTALREFLRLVQKLIKKANTQRVLVHPTCVFVTVSSIDDCGLNSTKLIKEMREAGWLIMNEDNPIQYVDMANGNKELCIALRPEVLAMSLENSTTDEVIGVE